MKTATRIVMTNELTVGSLFAGIGGFDLGFERAGLRTKWFVENDPYCQAVLKKHWPDVKCYADIRETKDLPYVDLLCGGFPCQNISDAGDRKGISGSQSSLWKEFSRVISEVKPRWAVVENVASLRTRGLDVVLKDLSSIGYDAEWTVIRASDIGAPHRRSRLWIIAYPNSSSIREQQGRSSGEGRKNQTFSGVNGEQRTVANTEIELQRPGLCESESGELGRGRSSNSGDQGRKENVADPLRQGLEGYREGENGQGSAPGSCESSGNVSDSTGIGRDKKTERPRIYREGRWQETWEHRTRLAEPWSVESDVCRVVNGLPHRVDRLRLLGNSLVPQIAEWIGREILRYEGEV
jgi:DNA (cytosine-5)-methyltransferase 1